MPDRFVLKAHGGLEKIDVVKPFRMMITVALHGPAFLVHGISSTNACPACLAGSPSQIPLQEVRDLGLQFTMDGRPIDAGFIAADQAGVGRDFFRTWIDENEMTSGHHELM